MLRNRLNLPADRWRIGYLLPVVIAPFVLLYPVWLTGKALFWGTVSLQFVPWRVYAWELLRSGHLPLWNPLNGMGAPLLANYQAALIYPPNWLFFLLQGVAGIGWAAWGQAILVAAHLAWAGLGLALLARRLGLSALAQSISGLAFGLSGYLVARSGFLSINASVSWIPWVLLATQNIVNQRDQRKEPDEHSRSPGEKTLIFVRVWQSLRGEVWGVRWLVLTLALQLLAGHAQTAWYTVLLCGIWLAFQGWRMADQQLPVTSDEKVRANMRYRLRSVCAAMLRLALALVLAGGLAAAQLLPTAEYLRQSQRADQVDYDFAMNYSFWPWRLLSFMGPDMFGNPVRGDYWGYGNFWEDAVYIGLLPFIMALSAVIKQKGLARFLFGLVLVAFLLALGKNTPLYPWLYRWVPTFAMFQAPTRISIWAVFALALLAGIGVQAWRRPTGRGLYWTRLGTAGAVAVMMGAGLAWYFLSDISLTFLRATALAGMWGVGTGLLTLIAPAGEESENSINTNKFWPVVVILFVMADLLVAGWGLNPGIERSFYARRTGVDNPEHSPLRGGRVYMSPRLEYVLKFERFMRFDTFQPEIPWGEMRSFLLPNLNLLEGLPSVNNFDPLVPGRYTQWMEALDGEQDHSALLNLMAVSAVEEMEFGQEDKVQFNPIDTGVRIRWVPCAIVAHDEHEAWEMTSSGRIDFDRQVILEGAVKADSASCIDDVRAADIQIVSEHPNRLDVVVQTPSSGWFVLSDVWYPGWRASINNAYTPIWRANYLFRAVHLGAGEHEVIFSYQPASFYLGVLISFFALLIVWTIWRYKR